MKSYKDWYFLNDDSRVVLSRGQDFGGLTPEERYYEIADHAEKVLRSMAKYENYRLDGFADRMKKYFRKGWASLATPVWNNFGRESGLPISCFGSYIGDNISHMYKKNAEIAVMTQKGGGTSFYLGAIRPRGSAISTGGVSEGPTRFAEIFDKTVEIVNQGGVRRGACASYLNADYDNPQDVLDFLSFREEHSPVKTLNIGITFTDEWISQLKEDIKNKVQSDKQKIWRKVLKRRDAKGIPYIMFKDNANRNKPQVYKDKAMEIVASNLCVAGDTKILTDVGFVPIESVSGTSVNVWNGEEWSKSYVAKTGEDKELYRVTLSDGTYLDCTDQHKWYIQEEYHHTEAKKKETKDLKFGDKLIKFSLPTIEGKEKLEKAYTNGFFSGDGCRYKKDNIIYLYGEKKNLKDYIETDGVWNIDAKNNRYTTKVSDLKEKFFVPGANYTIESRLSWLSGLLDADGTVSRNEGCEMIQLGSVELDFLRDVKMLLQEIGIKSKISTMRKAGFFDLPANDGTGEVKQFYCNEAYRLTISAVNSRKLVDLGLKCNRLSFTKKDHQRDASKFVTVVSVELLEGFHDTYCFNEPKRHMGVFNGVLTGQCNEIYLPSNEDLSFVCCLSSLNLVHFGAWKHTMFVQDMHWFLDAVMQEFIDKSKEIPELAAAYKFAVEHRALGLGWLGYHSALKDRGLGVSDFAAYEFNHEVAEYMVEECHKANVLAAEVFGEPELLTGYGLRNTTSIAIAPTLSSSFVLGQVSAGIELDESVYYSKNGAKGDFAWRCPAFTEVLEKYGMNTEEVWDSVAVNHGSVEHLEFLSAHEKNVFKSSPEVNQVDVLAQAGQRQKVFSRYGGQGQSLNIRTNSDMTLKQKSDLLFKAHELGLNGVYYQISDSAVKKATLKNEECVACSA